MGNFERVVALVGACGSALALASPIGEMQRVGAFEIDRTEVTVGQFSQFVTATKFETQSEKRGEGLTYESGWEARKGWSWRAPFGKPAGADEPAVHITYDEAAAFCKWAGKRLPTDREWGEAAYTERRAQPTDGFVSGKTYPYPTGENAAGANCLGDCGAKPALAFANTTRGSGHANVGVTKRGVNGLFDMGANAWEWVDSGPGAEKRTRGGSWWYGAAQMKEDHVQTKPATMAVVFIGFRCAR
jgi:formylglycine-generating enzyme